MDTPVVIEKMSVSEKIQMMEALWDSLCHETDNIVFPPWHQEVLTQRDELLKSGADQFEDWDSAKARIRNQTT